MNKVTEGSIVASQIKLPEGDVTRGGVKEYLEAIRERYIRAGRKEKSRVLAKSAGSTVRL